MSYFLVKGGRKLKGEVKVPGAKNAALPMLCAALLTKEECFFENVPNISDVHTLLDIFQALGVRVERNIRSGKVLVQAKNVDASLLESCVLAKKLRASILCLGPLLARFGEVGMLSPGGCIIGARPAFIHVDGLATLGARVIQADHQKIKLSFSGKIKSHRLLLSEASVTGTENLAMFLAAVPEKTQMFFTAAEPHVCATLTMLQTMGAKIEGIGTHHLNIFGSSTLKGGTFVIPPDGILVGTYAVAAALTGGDVRICGVNHEELFSFYGLLKRIGVSFEMEENCLHIHSSGTKLEAIPKVQTAIFPGFSTDLQSPMGVLLTQCEGETMIFETLFENRLTYLSELEKMGAQIEMLNAHQAKIKGPVKLKGAEVQSWDLRAGAAMVLAGLVAEGETKVTNIAYIDRGYEDFVENLQDLGADIQRVGEESVPNASHLRK